MISKVIISFPIRGTAPQKQTAGCYLKNASHFVNVSGVYVYENLQLL